MPGNGKGRGGNSHRRSVFEGAVNREVTRRMQEAASISLPTIPKIVPFQIPVSERIFRVIENAIIQTLFGILGGLVGGFVYGPFLAFLSIFVFAGVHRSKALEGLTRRSAVASWCGIVLVTIGGLIWIGEIVDQHRDHPDRVLNAINTLIEKGKSSVTNIYTQQSPADQTAHPLNREISLKQRTESMASQLFEFADARDKDPNEVRSRLMAGAIEKAMNPNDPAPDRYIQDLRNSNAQTQDRFVAYYWPQVTALVNDLSNAGVDISPISRAVALEGPRAIALRLSAIAKRIGKNPPFDRIVTSLEAQAIAKISMFDHIEVYADEQDANSRTIAEALRKGFESQHWNVNPKVTALPDNALHLAGIHIIYPYADVETQDTIRQAMAECDLKATLEKRAPTSPPLMVSIPGLANKQPVITVKLEVWPEEKPKQP